MTKLIACCENCSQKDLDQSECYHGRPSGDCPAYKAYYTSIEANEPPEEYQIKKKTVRKTARLRKR